MNDNARNLMLNALAGTVDRISLHTAYPGTTGTSEVTGGSPAYARFAVTWSAASSSILQPTSLPIFDVPAGTVAWAGLWHGTGGSSANFYGAIPLGAGTPLLAAAQSSDTFTAPGHTLSNGQTVVLLDTLGNIPGGVTEGTIYFVRDVATDVFKLAATLGGAAIDLLTGGFAEVSSIIAEVYASQGVHVFSTLQIVQA